MNAEEELPIAPLATAEEQQLTLWAEDVVQKGLQTVNDSLGRMVGLTTALLAGSAAMLSSLALPSLAKGIGSLLLLIALGAALAGSFPREIRLPVNWPDGIRRQRERIVTFKVRCLQVASAALLLAFTVVLGSLLLG